ncbi:putative C6 transcription factor [Aspergillus thermomutatus]|uniref:SGNH hydrolase-type esterase domain-containing protein n=1 Tax=Aspergillus thermomutatus TaxID=41047 RepID=A0A397G211_ASPTH|nr:uncharacterized protein CDV56_101467 [Aspergillus thermomutatus]RHZ43904.1 hypothetical protein CDV56_101467 [Aspergillus thermomutatus]
MKLAFTVLVLALTPTATVSAPLQQRSRALLKKFTSLVVFGDSYTDNGVRSYTPPVAAESTKTSDGGRVWPSYIRQYTGANIYDYAKSGAVCDVVVAGTVRNAVKQNQVPTFLADNGYVSNTTGQPALVNPPDETVYAIWIGTNDIGYGGFLTELEPAGMPLTYMTDCVYAQLDRLYATGARVFVLMNMAPLDLTPLYALPQNGGSVNAQYWTDKAAYDSNITRPSEKMRQYVKMVNTVYDYQTPYDVVVADRYPHSIFAVYDVHALMTDIWANPSHYLNGTAPYNVTSSVYRCGSPCASNEARDSYLWYDDLHPSEQTDRIIAREFVNLVKGQSKRPAETANSHFEEETTLSPGTISSSDEYAANPRFLQLQEELRDVLFTAVASHAPTRHQSPRPSDPVEDSASGLLRNSLDFAEVSIPKIRLIHYLKNWIIECAPHLDKFDEQNHFGVHIPVLAQSSPALFYAILAFSARQTERKACLDKSYDSLELYQQSIRLLSPYLEAKDPNVLVTVCILGCLELMSVSPRDWRRHVEGCAALFDAYNVNGFSGGHLQAVFWCYARMELCGAIISEGTEGTILPLHKWVPPQAADSEEERDIMIKNMFCQDGCSNPDRHANWAVYLCAKTCNLACRRSRFLELGELDQNDTRPFSEQWSGLWDELQFWHEHRCPAMLPIRTTTTGGDQIFPDILFAHWAAISGNQLYHTACIMMLQMKPANTPLLSPSPHSSPVWHARRVCGISLTNPHSGNLINAIQPLYIAGKLLSHRSEHLEVARLFKKIETSTGWGALWRLRDLERAWGYETGEILSAI